MDPMLGAAARIFQVADLLPGAPVYERFLLSRRFLSDEHDLVLFRHGEDRVDGTGHFAGRHRGVDSRVHS